MCTLRTTACQNACRRSANCSPLTTAFRLSISAVTGFQQKRTRSQRPQRERPRLVIMPFAAETNVPPYLGSSIAEETIALLTGDPLSPVRVLARDSSFSLAARGMHAHQVGEALRADLVLTGTLRALPSHFRLRAEMIRVADGTQIWVEDMLVSQARAAGLESELAHRLFVRLGTYDPFQSKPKSLAYGSAENPDRREAYEVFLRGHHEWQTLQRHRMQDGIQHLRAPSNSIRRSMRRRLISQTRASSRSSADSSPRHRRQSRCGAPPRLFHPPSKPRRRSSRHWGGSVFTSTTTSRGLTRFRNQCPSPS